MILGRLFFSDSVAAGNLYMVTHYGKNFEGHRAHLITRYDVSHGGQFAKALPTHRVTWLVGSMIDHAADNHWICLQYCTE